MEIDALGIGALFELFFCFQTPTNSWSLKIKKSECG